MLAAPDDFDLVDDERVGALRPRREVSAETSEVKRPERRLEEAARAEVVRLDERASPFLDAPLRAMPNASPRPHDDSLPHRGIITLRGTDVNGKRYRHPNRNRSRKDWRERRLAR